jgi:hypothetical protein
MLNSEMWPAWLAIGFAILLTLNQLLSESEKFANLLGRFGRKLHARARDRRRMDTIEFTSAVREAVNEERERWERDEERALKIMEDRLEYVTDITKAQQEQLKGLSFDLRCLTAYSEYETSWHNRLRMLAARAATNGGKVPIEELPPHIGFGEFEERCKREGNMRWREWNIL